MGAAPSRKAALRTEDKEIVVVSQRDVSVDEPGASDLYTIGTRAVIRKVGRTKDQMEVLVFGVAPDTRHMRALRRVVQIGETGVIELQVAAA